MNSRTIVRRVSAVLATLAIGLGFSLTAPLMASAATTSYSLDCNSVPYNNQTFYVVPGDTITFTLTGFTELYDNNTSTTIRALNPAGDTVVAVNGDWLDFWDPSNTCTDYFDAFVVDAGAETVPSGNLLFTQNMSLSSPAQQITVTDNSAGAGDHIFNGDSNCAVSVNVHGMHVYSTLDITVLSPGTFTFRGLSSSPAGYYVGLAPFDPIGDPFLAVYSNFDPANPDTGVVGCNDDLNDIGAQNDAEYLTDGSIIDGHQPYFTASFTPGQYTLVLMTYNDLSAADFAAGVDQYENDTFAIGTKTTSFQIWGPAGSLALGRVGAAPGLAATGTGDLSFVWIGIAGLLAGAVFMLVGYRRRTSSRRTTP